MKKIYAYIVWFFVITGAVTVGVYLGVKSVANEQETKKRLQKAIADQKVLKKVLRELLVELRGNAGHLSLRHEYHRTIRDTLRILVKDKKGFKFPSALWKGTGSPTFHSTVYTRLSSSQQLVVLPAFLHDKLAQIHDLQQELVQLRPRYHNHWWAQMLKAQPRKTALVVLIIFKKYCMLEQKLDKLYNEVFVYIRTLKDSKTDK